MTEPLHIPVMLDEVIESLRPLVGDVVVDCTLGLGGHSEALLERTSCSVIGLDRDPDALERARGRLERYGDRFTAYHACFSDLSRVLKAHGTLHVQGILADLGVSSMQLDQEARGFSFRNGGPVDMRMDPTVGRTAADIVNTWSPEELAHCIATYGEERRARRVASVIVDGRPWSDTKALASAVAKAVGGRRMKIHPATRTFQALRIAVNDELGELERFLPIAVDHLAPGGRMAVISFHSLEDRLVKRFFRRESGRDADRDPYGNPIGIFRLSAPSRSLTPSDNDPNPRSRSARLRVAVRLS